MKAARLGYAAALGRLAQKRVPHRSAAAAHRHAPPLPTRIVTPNLFTNWVTNDPTALHNKVHSFTKASFRPLKTGPEVTFMLEPEPLTSSYSVPAQSLGNVPNNYYTLHLNQSDADVKSKNYVALGSKIVSSLLGHLVGYPSSANLSQSDCVAALTLAVSNEIGTSLATTANTSPNEVIVSLLKSGTFALLKTGYQEPSRRQTLFRKTLFIKQLT